MGTLDWRVDTSVGFNRFFATVADIKRPITSDIKANIITTAFEVNTGSESSRGTNCIAVPYNYSRVYVGGNDYNVSSVGSLKNDLLGVMLYYELTTPIITDISDILPADNFIGVEGNGTLTFVNENGYAVPSKIKCKPN